MTPREFQLAVEGFMRRQEYERRMVAAHACWIANVWLPRGKRLKVEDLLGDPSEAPPAFLNKESLRQYMRERIAKAKTATG